ncbi:MAG: DUF45 domain-containing protein [Candidatus Gracilibacteria bacterium]|nr:DUF45 domain-containing protein [Candidatus Gracilibacteria bacterium]
MFHYTLIRSKRRTLSIQISKHGELIARAPMRMPVSFIENFIERKKDWIKELQEKIQNAPSKIQKEEHSEIEIIAMKKKLLEYIVPKVEEIWKSHNLPKYASIKITKSEHRWGSCSGKNGLCFSYRLAGYLDSPPEKGELEGVIQNKNSSHVTLPNPPFSGREFIDAIITHELAHLREKNHQKPFWNLVYTMMPEYEKIMKAVKI